jgi:hypothetical protein
MNKAWWLSLLLVGCGGRPAFWDTGYSPQQTVGLRSSVAAVDGSQNRVLMLSSPAPLELKVGAVPVGLSVATIKASPDGKQLFVLSRGVQPRFNDTDELPRLTVIESEPTPRELKRYNFSDPLSGLVIDPEMEWAIAYITPGDSRAVRNPNEINLIDLKNPDADPIKMTVQSGAGSPKSFLFTKTLTVPNGDPRRFLIVQTESEVILIDLLDAAGGQPEQLRMELPHNQQGAVGTPVQVVFHDALIDEERPNLNIDSEIAVRASSDSSVLLLRLATPANPDNAFDLKPNLLEVGGVPSTIEFVKTNAGIRLLALVGTTAALVDPNTSNSVKVTLPAAFKAITRVTEDIATDSGGDVALLWSDQAATVGLWNFGESTTTSHGLERLEVGTTVSQVLDVPGTSFPTYKILESREGDFFVLDLASQETSPMDTNGRSFAVDPSPDGERLWAYLPGSVDFASINLADLHATTLTAQRPISGVFEVGRPSDEDAPGRSALVLHQSGGDLAVTVLDGLAPDSAKTKFFSGLIFEGMPQ